MTLMRSISKLTTSVDRLAGATNLTKADLDAKVSAAEAEILAVRAELVATETARDEASVHAADASTHLETVQADVTYQGIAAILATKGVTASKLLIYDTSLDSDGGAWRKRCQHTSWYNEPLNTTIRGKRRDFPAVAVILVTSNQVTIYDGDDPEMPMWMVIRTSTSHGRIISYGDNGHISQIAALNGTLVASVTGSTGNTSVDGLFLVEFPADSGRRYSAGGLKIWPYDIARRDDGGLVYWSMPHNSAFSILGSKQNGVAMTALPDAPVDPATRLPVPTIAAATAAGLSVIMEDGSIRNITYSGGWGSNITNVGIGNGNLYFQQSQFYWLKVPLDALIQDHVIAGYGFLAPDPFVKMQPGDNSFSTGNAIALGSEHAELAYPVGHKRSGLVQVGQDGVDHANITAHTTSGWMPGAIRGAFLADTDTTALVASDELVTNGTFETDTSGWTPNNLGLLSVDIQRLKVETGNSGSWNYAYQQISVAPGQAYRFRASSIEGTATSHRILLGTTVTSGNIVMSGGALGSAGDKAVDVVFTATTSSIWIALQNTDGVLGAYTFFDDVSLVPASADRSANNKGLILNGTIKRSPVVDGAELAAYSGFSGSNYLAGTDASYLDSLYALGWEQTSGNWEFKHGVVSAAPIDGLTITGNTLKIAGTNPKALIRLTTTAPASDQIAKIYQDEKRLFQQGAKCTLFGTSDAVTALAHDTKTNLLHVGTSQGRSLFDGLLRVDHTETPVATAISAVNGLIVER